MGEIKEKKSKRRPHTAMKKRKSTNLERDPSPYRNSGLDIQTSGGSVMDI